MGEIFKFGPEHLKKVDNPKWDKSKKQGQVIRMDIGTETDPEELEDSEEDLSGEKRLLEGKVVSFKDNQEEKIE